MREYKNNIPIDLEKIYDAIIDRFPSGSLAKHIRSFSNPRIKDVLVELKLILIGKEHYKRYNDEQSKIDAQEFINELINYGERLKDN